MKKIFICLFAMLLAVATQAQSTLNSSGSSAFINGNTFSYSIGEMALVHTATGSNIVVTQGVLQGSGVAVGISYTKLTDQEFKVYPNPTRDILNLEANLSEKADLKLKLYDISGRELLAKDWKVSAAVEQTRLSLQSYIAGNYILHVQYKKDGEVFLQSYMIQKFE